MMSSPAPLSPTFLDAPSRFLFFTGKGGVGKTALSCATALRLANAGKRVLLLSTDPASNLDEMLGVPRRSAACTTSRQRDGRCGNWGAT
jgi:CO dehydrogenase nickel-insertion accessory protein CooC1